MSLDSLILDVQEEFPSFKMVNKSDSRLMKVLAFLYTVITFGRGKGFMSSTVTVIGNTMYMPGLWKMLSEATKVRILRHERVHFRQQKRYTRLGFILLYLFVPFPIGVAYFRMKFEREAYEETIRTVAAQNGLRYVQENQTFRETIIEQFVGPQYFWMWPFRASMARWYGSFVEELSNG